MAAGYGLLGLSSGVRCGAFTDPEADPERSFTPFPDVCAADGFHGADQGCGTLKLLQGQEAQCVPHQNRHTVLAGSALHRTLEPPEGNCVRG